VYHCFIFMRIGKRARCVPYNSKLKLLTFFMGKWYINTMRVFRYSSPALFVRCRGVIHTLYNISGAVVPVVGTSITSLDIPETVIKTTQNSYYNRKYVAHNRMIPQLHWILELHIIIIIIVIIIVLRLTFVAYALVIMLFSLL